MANETYRIIAKHFAKTIDVQLEFQEGACPATDGEKIILPTEMDKSLIDVTMGALLHETAHIRMTDFSYANNNPDITAEMMFCLNALEDIRIDHETYKLYPNARGFQGALVDHCMENAKTMQKIADEILACKILKAIIFKANGYDPSRLYDDKVLKVAKSLYHYGSDVKGVEFIKMVELAKDLYKEIFRQIMQEAKNISGSGTEGEKKEAEKSMGFNPDDLVNDYEQYDEHVKNIEQGKKETGKDIDEHDQKVTDFNATNRKKNIQSSKLEKLQQERADAQSQGNDVSAYDKAIEEMQKNIDALKQQINDLADNIISKKDKIEKTKEGLIDQKRQNQGLVDKMKEYREKSFSQTDTVDLLGFDALKDLDFKPKTPRIQVEISKRLDEIVKEILVLKYEEKVHDEDGFKLDASKLANLYTDVDSMFTLTQEDEKKTHVAFIVDVSGSMGGCGNGYGGGYSADHAVTAVKVLADSLMQSIIDGAPVDFSIFFFANNVVRATETAEDYQHIKATSSIEDVYNQASSVCGGGTNLLKSVDTINEMLADVEGDDRIAIVITDAEVSDYELIELQERALDDKAKFVWVGAGVDAHYLSGTAKSMFEGKNITNRKNAVEVLSKCLLDTLQ